MFQGDESRFQEAIKFYLEDCDGDFNKLEKLITKRIKNIDRNKFELVERNTRDIYNILNMLYLIKTFMRVFLSENHQISDKFKLTVLDEIEQNEAWLDNEIIDRKKFLLDVCVKDNCDASLYLKRVERMNQDIEEELERSISQRTILYSEECKYLFEEGRYIFADGSYLLKLEDGTYWSFSENLEEDEG